MEEPHFDELIFEDPEEKDTFHHLITLGEKSNRVLKHLKLDLGKWFTEDLLTIEKGYEKVKYLLVLADDSVDISDLPKEYSGNKMPRENIFVFDIGANPPQIIGMEYFLTYGFLQRISTRR